MHTTHPYLSADILEKIAREYPSVEDQETLLVELDTYMIANELEGARIPRCLLYLAKGTITGFMEALSLAKKDWRDVILWAEYEAPMKQVRDFNQTFAENGV